MLSTNPPTFTVLRALYELESPTLSNGRPDELLDMRHDLESIAAKARELGYDSTSAVVGQALESLWRQARVLCWPKEKLTDRRATWSEAFQRDVDDSPAAGKWYRSRVAEVARCMGYNYQRFGLLPSTSGVAYELERRHRPKRDTPVADASAQIASNLPPAWTRATEIVMAAVSSVVGQTVAAFQVRAAAHAIAALAAGREATLAVVAGVSSGKTLAFIIPALVTALVRAIEGEQGRVRALLVYPRSTLVEDQFQRIRSIIERIQSIAGNPFLRGAALDAAGKLSAQLNTGGVMAALNEGFPADGPCFEIVLTTLETLKRRVQNPAALLPYVKDLDLIVVDEVHLLDGLQGSHAIQLLRRIAAARAETGRCHPLSRIATSATIADPAKHVGAIFDRATSEVTVITTQPSELELFALFHHVFVRAVPGSSLLSTITNGASCIVHNRANGLSRDYYEKLTEPVDNVCEAPADGGRRKTKGVEKTIAFVDSLATIGRWHFTLADNEAAIADKDHMGHLETKKRRYPYFTWFFEPLWQLPARAGEHDLAARLRPVCTACKQGRNLTVDAAPMRAHAGVFREVTTGPRGKEELPFDPLPEGTERIGSLDECPWFRQAFCWWFSQDDTTMVQWVPRGYYGPNETQDCERDRKTFQTFAGQIRPMAITSQVGLDDDQMLEDVNDLFRQPVASVFRMPWSALRRRLLAEVGFPHSRKMIPWRENFSLLIASPKIEVGVDFSNVRDGLMHHAIRNVASYQQKAGRVGREEGSDSLIVTFMTLNPVDFHYYRNLHKLADSRYLDPVPLKGENPDVLACHLFQACFDFAALRGHSVMIVMNERARNLNGYDYGEIISGTVKGLTAWGGELEAYLHRLAGDVGKAHVEPAKMWFEHILALLNHPVSDINPGHTQGCTWATLIQERKPLNIAGTLREAHEKLVDLQQAVIDAQRRWEKVKGKTLSPLVVVTALENLRAGRLDDVKDQAGELAVARERVNDEIDDDPQGVLEEYLEDMRRALKIIKNIVKLVDNLGGNQQIALAFLALGSDYDLMVARSRQMHTENIDFYYLDALLTRLPYLSRAYPYVLPETFFTHPKSERIAVTVDQGGREQMEMRSVGLTDLLPGAWTYRYGQPAKVPCGRINLDVGSGLGMIDVGNLTQAGFDSVTLDVPIEPNDLPEDYPATYRQATTAVEVIAPVRLKLKSTRDRVLVSRVTSLVADGDESEATHGQKDDDESVTEGGRYEKTPTLPRSSALTWYKVDIGLAPPTRLPLSSTLFAAVHKTDRLRVTQFCYGLSRSYGIATQAPSLYYVDNPRSRAVCLGDQLVTDGLILELPSGRVKQAIEIALSTDTRDGLVRKALAGFLLMRANATVFSMGLLRETLVRLGAEKRGELRIDIGDIGAVLATRSAEELVDAILDAGATRAAHAYPPSSGTRTLELLQRASQHHVQCFQLMCDLALDFDEEWLRDWTRRVLVHSIALKAYYAACRVSGASTDQLGYFYNREGKVYLFDRITGGSGFCELVGAYLNPSGRSREFDATSSFVEALQDEMLPCASNRVTRACSDHRDDRALTQLPADLRPLERDIRYEFERNLTGEVLRWMADAGGNAPLRYRASGVDDLLVARDSAVVLAPAAVADGLFDAKGAFEKFERAIGGCVDACPECLDDPGSSLYGQFLNREYVDTRLCRIYANLDAIP